MKKKLYYLLLVPGLVLLIMFLVMPLLQVILPTFKTDAGSIGLSRYLEFFQDEYYMAIFFRTLKISVISALVCMLLGVPTAYFISRCNKKWRGILMAVSIFPMLTNSVVRSFAWITILGKKGVINNLLLSLGVIEKPITLLYTEFSVTIGTIYLFLPLMIITLIGVMENIDNDMLEASESLGANKFTSFMKVILPLSLPGILVGTVLVFTGSLSAYTTPQLLGGSKNLVLATFIQQASSLNDWNRASVFSVVMIVTTLIVIKLLNALASKLDKRGDL